MGCMRVTRSTGMVASPCSVVLGDIITRLPIGHSGLAYYVSLVWNDFNAVTVLRLPVAIQSEQLARP